MAKRLFTSESVTEGHPDKVCDQISDAVLDDILAHDPTAHVACETFTTTGIVTVMGEITTSCYVDIAAVARMLKAENSIALLHTDAVQGFLKVPFSAKTLGADMITISGHKIHAPKGIGALYIRSGLKLPPYILGGGQERGMRAGTEATPQIAAFGTAAEIGSAKMAQATKTLAELRAHAIDRLPAEVDGLVVIGGGALRFRAVPSTIAVQPPPMRGLRCYRCLSLAGRSGRRGRLLLFT